MTKRPEKKKSTVTKKETAKKDQEVKIDEQQTDIDPDIAATHEFIGKNKCKMPIIGVRTVAEYLGYSMRTVHSWRAEFPDFPVTSDGAGCIWRTTKEDLDEWRERHIDLFFYRKERINNPDAYRKKLEKRRRW